MASSLLEILGPRRLLFEAPVTHLTNACAINPYECWTNDITYRIVFFTSVVCVSYTSCRCRRTTTTHGLTLLFTRRSDAAVVDFSVLCGRLSFSSAYFRDFGTMPLFLSCRGSARTFTPVLDLNAKQRPFMMKTELGGEVPSACCLGGGVPSA